MPVRREPDRGEPFHPHPFDLIGELGYNGHVGAESRPRAGTSGGLAWCQRYKQDTGGKTP